LNEEGARTWFILKSYDLHRKHLLDIESLSSEEINIVLDTARSFKAVGERGD